MTGDEGSMKDVGPLLVKWLRGISSPLFCLSSAKESSDTCDSSDSVEFVFSVICTILVVGV